MWETIYFKTEYEAKSFITKYNNKFQMELIFVQDGYGVEYKKLKQL
tara:strand:- start:1936 stop:2073 length:138 start_codon:yes stop_codon:yes gene_type:complete